MLDLQLAQTLSRFGSLSNWKATSFYTIWHLLTLSMIKSSWMNYLRVWLFDWGDRSCDEGWFSTAGSWIKQHWWCLYVVFLCVFFFLISWQGEKKKKLQCVRFTTCSSCLGLPRHTGRPLLSLFYCSSSVKERSTRDNGHAMADRKYSPQWYGDTWYFGDISDTVTTPCQVSSKMIIYTLFRLSTPSQARCRR